MSKHTQNDALCIADLSEYTISTGLYDYLYNEWYQRFSTDVTLKLSEHEQRKVAFYAGMKAAQQLLAPDAVWLCVKCKEYNPADKGFCGGCGETHRR